MTEVQFAHLHFFRDRSLVNVMNQEVLRFHGKRNRTSVCFFF